MASTELFCRAAWLLPLVTCTIFAGTGAISTAVAQPRNAADPLNPFSLPEEEEGEERAWYLVPTDNTLERKFRTLETLVEQERVIEAARTVQTILDSPADYLIPGDEGESTSLKRKFVNSIQELPKSVREAYDTQFNPRCQHLLEQYNKTGNPRHLQEAVRRFLLTSSGGKAAYRLASYHFDRGEMRPALEILNRLSNLPNQAEQFSPWLQLMRAICLTELGEDFAPSDELLDELAQQPIPLGGEKLTAANWIERFPEVVAQLQEEGARGTGFSPENWTAMRRSSSRLRLAGEFNMLPVTDWRIDAVPYLVPSSTPERERVLGIQNAMRKALREKNLPALPASNPIVIDDRIVISSFGTVAAFDRKDGELLWKSASSDSILEYLLNEDLRGRYGIHSPAELDSLYQYCMQELIGEQTTGNLSSDGKHVYVVRNNGLASVNSQNTFGVNLESHPIVPKSSNQLVAFNLHSGRLEWEQGNGTASADSETLAGHFVLGAPAIIDGRLFVLTENGSELFLAELDPEQGTLVWLQPLVNPAIPILRDRVRRISGLTPTYAAPYLICPTDSGTVVAVDLTLREIAWVTEYREKEEEEREHPFNQPFGRRGREDSRRVNFQEGTMLRGERWQESLPVVAGSRILMTPSDSEDLLAVDLSSGKQSWVAPRRDGLFIEVAPTGKVLIVGSRLIRCLSTDGESLWQCSLTTGSPAGRGVFRGKTYQLGLQSGELISIDSNSGNILASTIPKPDLPLGNLVVSNDQLFSCSYGELVAFRPLSGLKEELAREAELDSEKLSLLGQLKLHDGHVREGLKLLQQSYSREESPAVARLITETLLNADEETFPLDDETMAELAELMVSATHPPEVVFRYVDALKQMGRPLEALRVIASLLESDSRQDELISRPDERRVRLDAYAAGFMRDLYQESLPEQQQQLSSRILKRLEDCKTTKQYQQLAPLFVVKGLERTYRMSFSRHLSSELDRAEQAMPALTLQLEKQLLWLEQFGDEADRPEATARLAQLYLSGGMFPAASRLFERLKGDFAAKICLNGQTGRELLNEWEQRYPEFVPSNDAGRKRRWTYDVTTDLEAINGARGDRPVTVTGPAAIESPWKHWRFQHVRSEDLLEAYNEQHRLAWKLQLDDLGRSSNYALHNAGHLGLFQTNGELYGLNGFAKNEEAGLTPLWALRYHQESTGNRSGFSVTPATRPLGPTPLTVGWQEEVGQLAPIVDCQIPLRDGRRLALYDGITGEILWDRQNVQDDDALIWADRDYVYQFDLSTSRYELYRLSDGRSRGVQRLPMFDDLVMLSDSVAVLRKRFDAQAGRLIGYDLRNRAILWSMEISGRAKFAQLDEKKLVAFDQGNETLFLLDPREEKPVLFEQVVENLNPENLLVLSDEQRWYLHFSEEPGRTLRNLGLEMGPVVNGRIIAVNRDSLEIAWSGNVRNSRWLPNQPARLPFLMYGANVEQVKRDENGEQSSERDGKSRQLSVLDKATGQIVTELPEQIDHTLMQVEYDLEAGTTRLEFVEGTITIQAHAEKTDN